MDGLNQTIDLTLALGGSSNVSILDRPTTQRTLRSAIDCVGVGLHSGLRVGMTLRPAPANTGVVFRRMDLGGIDIPARYDHVSDTRLCTVLESAKHPQARVGTAEHLLAALSGYGIHNVLVEIDGPEVPILDGSAESFVFLIDCAGVAEQDEPVGGIEILRRVRVTHGDAFAELLPGGPGLDLTMSIDFTAGAIGMQSASVTLSPTSFRAALARARTFTQASEIDALRRAGLALGGSLDNAIVVDGDRVLNPGGLRMPDEFVRHKLLDAVGDLALAGLPLHGRFVGHRSGHALNNRLLRALFADDANWAPLARFGSHASAMPAMSGWREARFPAAAAPV